ncbi:glycoside hydrolase family 2 TIM barrel-domain containing protein [Schleiferilactobacillus harbinensis]|uniref:Glycoside hydrolase family 2 TIM barrel-domain containing protein n=1 Tax=Schleiferilactobacillus harbinensis TaxID=304207 RepID=A0ABU7T2B8_9LACO
MRERIMLNDDWIFHYGELQKPNITVKKANGLGGMTAPLPEEGDRLPISAGGDHFLKLIAQGNTQTGLHNLAGTDLANSLPGKWQTVTLPHDWKAELPYVDDPALLMSGSKEDGIGYYRRTFALPQSASAQRTILHFGGIMRMADIWLNGAFLGHNTSGYTEIDFDISEIAHFGDTRNVLLVRVDTTTGAEGWWYEGAGIYREAWLEVTPVLHIDADEAYVYTQSLQDTTAQVGIAVAITNDGDTAQTVSPVVTIGNDAVTFTEQLIAAGETAAFRASRLLTNVIPWTPENPHMLDVAFSTGTDHIVKQLGIHTFAYTDQGFFLNGQHYRLNGVCEHQDFAGVGTALSQDIVDYKVHLLKQMGVNAWRSAHHFASEELLNACDRYGILLINENRILEATPWRLTDLKKMVKRQRMHPSIAFWSLANEELTGNTSYGARNLKRLVKIVKQLDHESLTVSAELLNPAGTVNEDYLKNVDVLGVNYPEAGVMGDGALNIRRSYPQQPIMSTENGSYFETRGSYRDNAAKCQANTMGSQYSMVLPGKRTPGEPGVGGTATPEQALAFAKAHPEFGGVFLWTAFDYSGEPSPFGWPGIGSQFGLLDTCGFPKGYYYFFQAAWTTTPMVHVMPHWNQKGLDIAEDGTVSVRTFSNGDMVELFINGHSAGRQPVEDYRCDWRVVYAPGVLKAVAYRNGKIIAEDQQETAGGSATLRVSSHFAGKNQTLYQIQALDDQSRSVPLANDQIQIQAVNGNVIGLGNGDPADTSPASLETIHLFNGQALVIATRGSAIKASFVSKAQPGKDQD